MTDKLDKESVWRRLEELIDRAASAANDYNSDGPLERADFDELEFLALHLSDELPTKFVDLAGSGFESRSYLQREIGRRLQRTLELWRVIPTALAQPIEEEELLPTFSLEEHDQTRVLSLCEQMRKIVFSSDIFDQPHKRRLLNRIAGIEKQVHQPKGLLDVVLAGVSDVGETVGKFGKDVKPLTDRMREVAGIARRGSSQYSQLPAPDEIKQLPSPDSEQQ